MERDADGAHVVAEHVTEVVAVHLADVGRTSTEAGDSDHRVGRRPAAHLDGSIERRVQLDGTLGLDQGHRPLDQIVAVEEVILGWSDHVDECVADTDHVESGVGGAGTVREPSGEVGHERPR